MTRARASGIATVVTSVLILAVMQAGSPAGAASAVEDRQSIDTIDSDTLAVMRRQEALEPALRALWEVDAAERRSGFAGVAYEGDGLTLYWKGPLTSGMRDAVARARKTAQVTIRPASYSAAELEADAARIQRQVERYGATDIQSVGLPADGSGLVVTVQPASTRERWAARRAARGKEPIVPADRLLAHAGVTVPVRYRVAADELKQASRTADLPPWKGGARWGNASKGLVCTTGFGVHAFGGSYVLTAAHCASAGDTVTQNGRVMGPVYWDDRAYDIMLIDADGWHTIYDGSPTTSNTKNVNGYGYWASGKWVCQSGATSGVVCDLQEQQSVNVMWPQSNPDSDGAWGYTVYGLIMTTKPNGTAARAGDSGAPVFSLSGSGVRAEGILAAVGANNSSEMFFQDWDTIITRFAAYPNTTSTLS